jgi:uncharacterized protein (DUF2384 family)
MAPPPHSQSLHRESPQAETVVTKAVLRAAERFEIHRNELGAIIGVSEASLSRMSSGAATVSGKSQELALLLVRLYRSLDAWLGGDEESAKAWLRAHNSHLRGTPIQLMQTVPGLIHVIEYLDAMRGKI